jgi:hypothetical protein
VYDQFDPSNTSHHAVRAPRYTANSADTNSVNAISYWSQNPTYAGSVTQVKATDAVANSKTAFANISAANKAAKGAGSTVNGYTNLRYQNGVSYIGTLSDLGKFITAYKPLANGNVAANFKPLADNSQLHCGDCHTVGQWAKRGSAAFQAYSAAYGAGVTKYYKEAIGAHGSGNEYMLRNNNGDNKIDPMAMVCFNCHADSLYGYGSNSTAARQKFNVAGITSNGIQNGTAGYGAMAPLATWTLYNYTSVSRPYGKYISADDGTTVVTAHGTLNSLNLFQKNGTHNNAVAHDGVSTSITTHCVSPQDNTAGLTGLARLNSTGKTIAAFYAYTTGKYNSGGPNAYGMTCANCHNSGDGTYPGFGGIHGNAFRVGYTVSDPANMVVIKNASYTTYSTAVYPLTKTNAIKVSAKPYRFLPGLGNFRYNGGNWTLKTPTAQATNVGCYTLNGTSSGTVTPTYPTGGAPGAPNAGKARYEGAGFTAGDNGLLGTWGACTDHSGNDHGSSRNVLRPLQY